ncbi:MAG: nitrite reductase small subunit NirD [Acidimicrobiales bacterium]
MSVTEREVVWMPVCEREALTPDRGVAVLLGSARIAVFVLAATATDAESVVAVDHVDPATGVAVIARGLVGSTGDRTFVASPLHKQRYDLVSGECLDDPDLTLRVWPVRVRGGVVEIGREAMNSST